MFLLENMILSVIFWSCLGTLFVLLVIFLIAGIRAFLKWSRFLTMVNDKLKSGFGLFDLAKLENLKGLLDFALPFVKKFWISHKKKGSSKKKK